MIAEKITFGEHEQEEFGLLPKQVTISPPEVKTYLVPVPGRSGSLDFTEALTDGQPAYYDRQLIITMYCFAEDERLPEMEAACRNALHGRKLNIMLDCDPGYYYRGRLSVDWVSEENIDIATITADCDPYKYKLSPTLSLEVNKTGSFTFTQYPNHPMAGLVQKLRSVITVEKDGAVLFRGRPLSSKEGFYKQQDYTCEGELAFLLDSRVRPFEMAGGVTELFTYLINQHNEQVDEYKRFKVGRITVTDPNDYINRSNITYETTLDILKTRLLDTLGGYLWVRHEADGVYLDYLEDFPYMSTQRITFGENLLDYARTRDGSEIATALIPLGARLEDEEGNQTDQRLTIAEANGGKDYVYDEAAVERYGWIFATQTWDDVTQAGNLKQKGLDALQEKIKTVDTIEMTAADLSQMNQNFDDFRVGQYEHRKRN